MLLTMRIIQVYEVHCMSFDLYKLQTNFRLFSSFHSSDDCTPQFDSDFRRSVSSVRPTTYLINLSLPCQYIQ